MPSAADSPCQRRAGASKLVSASPASDRAGRPAGRELARQGRRPGQHEAGACLLQLGVDPRVGEGGAVAERDGGAVANRGEQCLPAFE